MPANPSRPQRLADLRRLSGTTEAVQREAASEARSALRYALAEVAQVRAFWDDVKESFRGGLEGEVARELLRGMLDVFDSWLGLAESASSYRNLATELGGELALPDELEATLREMKERKAAVESWRDSFFRPGPPYPARLEAARQALAQGQFKDAEAVRKEACGK